MAETIDLVQGATLASGLGLAASALLAGFGPPFAAKGVPVAASFLRIAGRVVPIAAGAGATFGSTFQLARSSDGNLMTSNMAAGCAAGLFVGGITTFTVNGALGGCMLGTGAGAVAVIKQHGVTVPAPVHGRIEDVQRV